MNLQCEQRALLGHVLSWACAMALVLGCSGSASAAEVIKIGGTGAALGTLQLVASELAKDYPDVRVTVVPNLGSSGGIKAVAGAAIDIAVTSRPANENERNLGVIAIEYARTPFVFAISTRSKVTAITLRELADIYAGKTVKWADGSPVRIVLRPASDTDTEMIKNISPEIRQALAAAERRPGVRYALTDQDAANELEKLPGAVGSSTLAVILSEKRPLRPLLLDGKEPTAGNVASGTYPYFKRLFLVTGVKRSTAVERFISFLQSPVGHKILTDNGHLVP